MNLIAVSINHRTAPVDLREAVFLSEDEIRAVTKKAKEELFKEGLVLSTCNRTEIFGIPANSELSHLNIKGLITDVKPLKQISDEYFENFISRDAVKHLYNIVSGIDSMLIGDNQIFKQIKESFQIAEEMGFVGFLMKRIFDSAIKTGKRAISETKISDGAVTVSYAAVQLIEKIFFNLSKKSALVIGAGETSEIAAKHLNDKNIGKLTITNRTFEKAEKLAGKINASVLNFSDFKNSLHNYDIIISATSAPGILLSKEDIKSSMKKRISKPMVLMDIALPRDVDPETKKIESVFYHDIDSLKIIVEQNLAIRKAEIPKVEKIIEEELYSFYEWYNSLQAAPTIKGLREMFESIRAEEVEKNINKFSVEDREKLEIVTKRIINKILHHPTAELKKTDETEYSGAARFGIIRSLFGIDSTKEEK
ncbi:MAG TPA: glutamyl-tRNA reductase [Ignavibacteriaceae bacterium]|nr:glutamyl-tRNA reductase [Ignavibacteriaceae bacterium]